MRPSRSPKIDHDQDYPCPCRRRGRLKPIFLTEAFGCDRCPHIFVIEENGHIIEQLSSTYPYKKAWRWTGYCWMAAHKGMGEGFIPIILGMLSALTVLLIRLAVIPYSIVSMIPWVLMVLFIGTLIGLIFWFVYRLRL